MELQFYGANCIRITTKNSAISVDDNLKELGLKPALKADDVALFTQELLSKNSDTTKAKLVIDQPGEYEVANISIQGIAARSHMDEEGQKSATIYKITIDDTKIVALGHIYPELTDKQLENIGMVDVLLVPVGGNGYTLDGVGALKMIKKIEPKLVVPTHYYDKEINYEVPQQELQSALQQLSMEPADTVEKLKLKGLELSDATKLIVIKR